MNWASTQAHRFHDYSYLRKLFRDLFVREVIMFSTGASSEIDYVLTVATKSERR
jgi:hypothetical protein